MDVFFISKLDVFHKELTINKEDYVWIGLQFQNNKLNPCHKVVLCEYVSPN